MIKITVRNVDKVAAFLRTVPPGTKRGAAKAVAEYMVGDSRRGLKHDDPYSQTTRRRVYGQQWESDKQRRYVMAKIKSGEIVIGSRRSSPTKASQGYGVQETRNGYAIFNKEPGAYWSRVWAKWPLWKNYNIVIKNNMRGALRSATREVNKILERMGR